QIVQFHRVPLQHQAAIAAHGRICAAGEIGGSEFEDDPVGLAAVADWAGRADAKRGPFITIPFAHSSNTATARIGEPVPPRHLSGKPMKRNSPWPIRVSRLHRLSMWVMSSARHALWTRAFTSPIGPGRM